MTMPPMETFGGKSIVDLKRGIGDTEAGSGKKLKLVKEEEKKSGLVKKCESEIELDEKVYTGSGARGLYSFQKISFLYWLI